VLAIAKNSLRARLQSRLAERRENKLWRQHSVVTEVAGPWVSIDGQRLLNCCSNDYLGLKQHPEVMAACIQATQKTGIGAGAAHLLSGHFVHHQRVEEQLAAFLRAERVLLFSSGYLANLAVITTLVGRHDVVYADRLNHASLLDAVGLSGARSRRYPHRDVARLKRLLRSDAASVTQGHGTRGCMLVTDAVFSMDGDVAPLTRLQQLAEQHSALLYVDEAHAFGVLGQGRGALAAMGMTPAGSVVMMGTLGKACGVAGAFVAADHDMIEGLVQFGRSYIYTTAMPPAQAVAISTALNLLQHDAGRRQQLLELIEDFRTQALAVGLPLMPSETPIQPLPVGDSARVLTIQQCMRDRGFLVGAIRPPTVAVGSARLRVTLTADMKPKWIRQLVVALTESFEDRS